MPSGNIDKPIIEDNRDGTVSVKYDPREEGLHELSVKYNGEHVQGELEVSKLVGNISIVSHFLLVSHSNECHAELLE